MTWRLYASEAQTPVEQGSVSCNYYPSGIRLGIKKAMSAGAYRFDADVEPGDGCTGAGSYSFAMAD
ncbi:hypothetical protein DFR72_107337 [Lentzea flaviverrucosa]|uniref:Uncharacterized protein n=2 Tax=Lentzea flaviverrucosa TaxID=200379 RepID=A0A1H9K0W5_9PSEU|nr:hypothetical protein DFR72_107337 [Lentzea flaviverrucosa]SEQ92455.1 hypothetical protein SAMN05216195_103430 [Lentzea flaviverrucosa]